MRRIRLFLINNKKTPPRRPLGVRLLRGPLFAREVCRAYNDFRVFVLWVVKDNFRGTPLLSISAVISGFTVIIAFTKARRLPEVEVRIWMPSGNGSQ